MVMKYLITYRCERWKREPSVLYGMNTTHSPVEWLEDVQKHEDEIYFLINVLPITDKEFTRIDGNLGGM